MNHLLRPSLWIGIAWLLIVGGVAWLVVPDASIVKPDELPAGWGLLTLSKHTIRGWGPHPATTTYRLRARTKAPKLTPEPLPIELLATLMRSTAKTSKRRAHADFCAAPCNHRQWEIA